MGISLGWNVGIDDTVVVDSIVMTTCMSHLSKPLLDFNSMSKFSNPQTCLSANVVHAYLYEVISSSK